MSESSRLVIVNDIDELKTIEGRLNELSESWDITSKAVFEIMLALEELVSNTIFYGYDDDDEHTIVLSFHLNGDALTISIEDNGVAFNPLDAETPNIDDTVENRRIGGLGIHLVRNLMDSVDYKRHNDMNCVTIVKTIR